MIATIKKSLGYQVLVAVVAGIVVGLFFGPLSSVLRPIGDIFSMLLQMVVLPYIAFSIIHGLGSLSPKIAKNLFKRGWYFLLLMWVIALLFIHMMGMLWPTPASGFVGYVSEQEKNFTQQFLTFLVPANPIYDFANNIVPAIAIFGLVVGGSILCLRKKEPLLSILERANDSIEKILEWLAIVSPIGIFAHIAVAVGTVNFHDLFKLEFYVIALIIACLYLTFWVLPSLLVSLTPMKYREIIEDFRYVCLLAFATGLPSIAFPFINKAVKRLERRHHLGGESFHSTAQTVIPLGYSFAQMGNFMMLFFMFFISFYFRHPFITSEHVLLNVLSVPLSFGSGPIMLNAVAFLVSNLNFPAQAFTLFVETYAITLNFQVLLSVAAIFTFIVLVLFAYTKKLRVNLRKLCIYFGGSIVVFFLLVLVVKHTVKIGDKYSELYENLSIKESIEDPVEAKLITEEQIEPHLEDVASGQVEPLGRILTKGILHVGFDPRNIPYCYLNAKGEPAGYDVAFAYQLAKDLDCKLMFVPLNLDQMGDQLSKGYYDIAMAAIVMNEERLLKMDFTHSYTEEYNVLVVPTALKSVFLKEGTQTTRKIGGIGAYGVIAKRHFPNAPTKEVAGMEELLSGEVEAIVSAQIPAFIWCLSHPDYVTLEFDLTLGKRFFAYSVRTGAFDWISFMNNWLELKKQTGFTEQQFKYWIQGESPFDKEPRWSILHNVLKWN
jgi:proton glutamate symport protein